jgi:protein O-mannosyl-transferase
VWHHAFSLAVHLLNSFLLLVLLRRLGAPEHIARLGAVVFAIHPIHVEPVTAISALGGVLAGTCVFAALICYLKFAQDRDWRLGAFAVGFGGVALFCKEDSIGILLSLGVLWLLYARSKRGSWWPVLAMLPVAVVWQLSRIAAGCAPGLVLAEFSSNPLTIVRNLVFHILQFLVSVRSLTRTVGFEWYYRLRDALPPTPSSPVYIAVVIVLAAVLIYMAWRNWGRLPVYAKAGLGLGLSGLAVFLPLPQSAARLMYIPAAGLSVAAVAIIAMRRSRVRVVLLSAWVILLSVSLVERASAWFGVRTVIERVLAEAVSVRRQYPPEIGTIFVDYPMRHYAAAAFASGLPEAVRWQTQTDWPYLYGHRDVPLVPETAPDSVVTYQWVDTHFVLIDPHNP